MRKHLAILGIALGFFTGLYGTAVADHEARNCSTIEGNTLQVCERQEVMGETIDLTPLVSQLTARGFTLPNRYTLVDALHGEAVSIDYLVLVHDILPYPQHQWVTTTITYDGAWHLTVTEEAGFNPMRFLIMGLMLLVAGFAAVIYPASLKLSGVSTCILAGVAVGLLIMVALLGMEWGGFIAILLLGLLFLVGLTRDRILLIWFVATATGFVGYSFRTTQNPEILIEWVLFCLFCVALQYIFYFGRKLWRRARPKLA